MKRRDPYSGYNRNQLLFLKDNLLALIARLEAENDRALSKDLDLARRRLTQVEAHLKKTETDST